VISILASGHEFQRRIHDTLQQIRRRFADFIAHIYFAEVSNELQPIELFEILRQRLRINELYVQLRENIEMVSSVVADRVAEDESRNITTLTLLGGLLGLGTVFVALTQLWVGALAFTDIGKNTAAWLRCLLPVLGDRFSVSDWLSLALFVLGAFTVSVLFFLLIRARLGRVVVHIKDLLKKLDPDHDKGDGKK
jgi:hypothetical protein